MRTLLVILPLLFVTSLFAQTSKTIVGYLYDTSIGGYVIETRTETTFDESGAMIFEKKSNFINDKEYWENKAKTTFSYSENGLIMNRYSYEWRDGAWIFNASDDYLYNGEGLVTSQISKKWDGVIWQNERKTITIYADGRMNVREQYEADGAEDWNQTIQEEYAYSDDGLESVLSLFTIDGDNWTYSSKTTTTFDANGNRLQEVVRANMGGVWDDFYKQDWTYTSTNQVDQWNEAYYTNGAWIPEMRSNNVYDDQDRLLETYWDKYNSASARWSAYWKEEHTYSETNSAVELAQNRIERFSLANNYPNPFNPSTQISFTLPAASDITLTVHNMLGKTVAVLANGHFTQGQHTKVFLSPDLAGGQYFYKLETPDFVEVKKMVLVK